MPQEDEDMPIEDERMPFKRARESDSEPEMIPDNPGKQNTSQSDSDSASSEELVEDRNPKGLRAKSRAKSKSAPKQASKSWSSPRTLPLPTTESGDDIDDTVEYESDHEDLVVSKTAKAGAC